MSSRRIKAYLYLLIVAIIWGVAGPVIKITLNSGLPWDIFLTLRFLVSSAAACIMFIFWGTKFPKDFKTALALMIFAILNSTVSIGLLFWGTEKTSLLDMSLISIFSPLVSIYLGYHFLHDRITKQEKIGTLVALIGSTIILLEPILEKGQKDGQITGNILVLLSVVTGALAGLMAKELLRKGLSASDLTNYSFIGGFLTMIPVVLMLHPTARIMPMVLTISSTPIWGILYMGLFSGTIAYILNNLGLKSIELSEAALFSYLYPIFSAILAVILLGDKITTTVIAGCIVTFAGVALAEIKKKRYN